MAGWVDPFDFCYLELALILSYLELEDDDQIEILKILADLYPVHIKSYVIDHYMNNDPLIFLEEYQSFKEESGQFKRLCRLIKRDKLYTWCHGCQNYQYTKKCHYCDYCQQRYCQMCDHGDICTICRSDTCQLNFCHICQAAICKNCRVSICPAHFKIVR